MRMLRQEMKFVPNLIDSLSSALAKAGERRLTDVDHHGQSAFLPVGSPGSHFHASKDSHLEEAVLRLGQSTFGEPVALLDRPFRLVLDPGGRNARAWPCGNDDIPETVTLTRIHVEPAIGQGLFNIHENFAAHRRFCVAELM